MCTYAVKCHVLSSGVGYAKISSFTESTGDEFMAAMRTSLNNCTSLIIDLRGNSGGVVMSATDIAAYFLPRGSILTRFAMSSGVIKTMTSLNRRPNTHLPICVLVDDRTASSCEILAAALAENGRAVVWGKSTLGKVFVVSWLAHLAHECWQTKAQAMVTLSDNSGLILSVAEWQSPTGRSLLSGVALSQSTPPFGVNDRMISKIRYSPAKGGIWLVQR